MSESPPPNLPELGNGVEVINPDPTPDQELTLFAQRDVEDVKRMQLLNARLLHDNAQSQKYCKRAYKITKRWICFLMVVIAAQYVGRIYNVGFTEAEFIAIIISLTGSVFGFWYLVGKYLFRSPS